MSDAMYAQEGHHSPQMAPQGVSPTPAPQAPPGGYTQPPQAYPGMHQGGYPQPTATPVPPGYAIPGLTPAPVPQAAPQPAPSVPSTLGGYETKDADPVIQSMLDAVTLAAPGLNLERAVGKALRAGDVSLVDADYIKEALPDGHARITALARQIVQSVEARADQVVKDVYALVGGEAQWNQAVGAFNKHAQPAIKKAVAGMLDSRNPEQIMAGAQMVQQFAQMQGLVPQVHQSPLGGYLPAQPGQRGMTSKEFATAIAKVSTREDGWENEWANLMRQRMVGMQVGLK